MKNINNSRVNFVLNNLKNQSEIKILDIGFIGEYKTSFLHEKIIENLKINDKLWGLDNNEKIKNFNSSDKITYLHKSLFDLENNFEFNDFFDVIIFCEVFEHLFNPFKSIEIIKKLLKPKGKLILTYPNPVSWRKLIRYIFTPDILNKNYISLYAGATDHKIFPFPPCFIKYFYDMNMKVEKIVFLKNALSKIPLFNKLSTYVGIVAKKS